jgi:hypothetical protein
MHGVYIKKLIKRLTFNFYKGFLQHLFLIFVLSTRPYFGQRL